MSETRIKVRLVLQRGKQARSNHEFSGSASIARLNAYEFILAQQPVTVHVIAEDVMGGDTKPTEIDDGMGGRYRPGTIIST